MPKPVLDNCAITLDSPWNSYYPGQKINGKANITFDEPKRITGIYVLFTGIGETQCKYDAACYNFMRRADYRSIDTARFYSVREEYFNDKTYIHGRESGDAIELGAGTHSFPFEFDLPQNLPTSFNDKHCLVEYIVKVGMKQPWKRTKEVELKFSVCSPLDLNVYPGAEEPNHMHMEKRFGMFSNDSGLLKVDVSVPATGYVSGQTIPITLNCDNNSDVDVESIDIALTKHYSLITDKICKFPEKTSSKAAVMKIPKIPKKTNGSFSKFLVVPPLAASHITGSKLMKLDYKLHIDCVVYGLHYDLKGTIPIVIGTVPLANSQPVLASEQFNMQPNSPLLQKDSEHPEYMEGFALATKIINTAKILP